MSDFIDELKDNSFYKIEWEYGSVMIKAISFFRFEKSIDEIINRFISIKTFPYVNTVYNTLLNESFDELPLNNKIEVKSIIQKYLNELDENKRIEFFSKTDDQICDEYGFADDEIKKMSRDEMFKSIKGGYYCEMLLYCVLLSLGYHKIVSKLFLQFGLASPTGIDAPFINLNKRVIVLGECKIFKNIINAVSSCLNDLNEIYNKDKFKKEFSEWRTKYSLLNEEFRNFLETNSIETFDEFINNINETICLGFVIGNEIEKEKLKNKLMSIPDYAFKGKMSILLVVIPIESKDDFIDKCYNALLRLDS